MALASGFVLIVGFFYNVTNSSDNSLIPAGIVYAFLAYALLSSAFKKKKPREVNVANSSISNKVKAFFIAPLLIPLSLALILYIFGGEGTGTFSKGTFPSLVFIVGIPITYLSVLVLGIPVYLHLEENNKLSNTYLFFSGAIAGSLVTFGVITEGRFSFKGMSQTSDNIIPICVFISILCGVTAIIYGKIAKGI